MNGYERKRAFAKAGKDAIAGRKRHALLCVAVPNAAGACYNPNTHYWLKAGDAPFCGFHA